MKPEHKKLNLGCGFRKMEDHWNIDKDPSCNPDEVIDLNQTPWPYEDDFFEKIQANMILQYLSPDNDVFLSVIKEMYRVSANQAQWIITLPHINCELAYDDFLQTRRFTTRSFLTFDQKKNFESVAKKTGENVLGFSSGVDIEITDMNSALVKYWQQQLESGMIGQAAFEIDTMTKNNVIESVTLFFKVHKPGRFQDWIPKPKQ
jgi:hypothetical protein